MMDHLTIKRLEEIEGFVSHLLNKRDVPLVAGLKPQEWRLLFAAARNGVALRTAAPDRDVLPRLEIIGSGRTYAAARELDFYTVTADAIAEIKRLRFENAQLKEDIDDCRGMARERSERR